MTRLAPGDSLLVRLPAWLGDLVLSEPTLFALTDALRRGRLRALSFSGPERFYELLDSRFEGVRFLGEGESWAGHDVALFLDGSMRSVLRAARARIPQRVSWFTGGRELFLTDGFRPALERGEVALTLGRRGRWPRRLPRPFGAACAELCGALGVAVVERPPRLSPGEAGKRAARERLASLGLAVGERYLVLDASARPGSAKGAPPELWASVLEGLREHDLPPVLLLTAPGEEEVARQTLELSGEGSAVLAADPPPTLVELLALIGGSTLFLGADSGPRHLAVATARPLVTLFGPSDPRHTADHLVRTRSLRLELPCAPCHQEVCPLEGEEHGACLSRLDPARIVAAVREQLELAASAPGEPSVGAVP